MALIENKKVRLRYELLDTYSAGIELMGSEVKSVRAGRGSLEGAAVIIRGGEAYLVGATIHPYQPSNTDKDYEPTRTRRLLLTKKELRELVSADSTKGLTIVPVEVYNSGRYIKLRLASAKIKGKTDKREKIKKAEAHRESERLLKKR